MLDKLIPGRLEEISARTLEEPKHISLSKEMNDITEKLKESLTPEQWKLFDEYVDATGKELALEQEYFYTNGFKDSAKLLFEAVKT